LELARDSLGLTDAEADFLSEHMLGRVATASKDGQPHVVPVVYEFDGKYLYFCGRNLMKSLKVRHMAANHSVAFVVDVVVSTRPWVVRGIEIRGISELLMEDGRPYVRITPVTKSSWGLR
jgi:pyridoxamine 5'-phosphate oxidase family protein